jgi:hypothetical protein
MPVLGEGRGRATMLVQLNAPAVEFDLVQPLLTARRGEAQSRSGRWEVTRNHVGIVDLSSRVHHPPTSALQMLRGGSIVLFRIATLMLC